MTNYARGDRAEKKVAALLAGEGYHVWQARGSKGHADVIAIKAGELVLIQVKGGAKTISHEGWNGLLALARLCDAVPVVADFPERTRAKAGPVQLRRVTAAHIKNRQTWPAEPFVLDRVAGGRNGLYET